MGFQEVIFLTSRCNFYVKFIKKQLEYRLKPRGSPHVLRLWLKVCMGM